MQRGQVTKGTQYQVTEGGEREACINTQGTSLTLFNCHLNLWCLSHLVTTKASNAKGRRRKSKLCTASTSLILLSL